MPEEPPWIAESLAAAGAISELVGKVKVAGKTTFVLNMSRRVLDGEPFMGLRTMKTPVVYLTEQPEASFRQALRRARLDHRDDFHVLHWHQTAGVPWEEVAQTAVRKAREIGAKLLIVDTLGQFAGLRGDAENSSGEALAAIKPLQLAAAEGIAVIVVRHERKSGGDPGDAARGSSAFAGAVDIILTLRRVSGGANTARELSILSRFDGANDKLVIDYQDGEYVALGTEVAVKKQRAKDAILAAAPDSEGDAKATHEFLEDAGVKGTTGKEALTEIHRAGSLTRVGQGVSGDPYRYWRPPES